jgi:hypothetical protein
MATENGPADEELFVKTNLNYGGRKEKRIPPEVAETSRMTAYMTEETGAYTYRVLKRKDVPAKLWNDSAHFIERFVTNSDDSFVRVYFAGVRIVIVKAYAPTAIKKLVGDPRDTNYVTDIVHLESGAEDFELSDTLKATVGSFVKKTPVEFGCIDLVYDDFDHYYVVDLNMTPSGGRGTDAELNDYLQLGITDPAYRKSVECTDSPLV